MKIHLEMYCTCTSLGGLESPWQLLNVYNNCNPYQSQHPDCYSAVKYATVQATTSQCCTYIEHKRLHWISFTVNHMYLAPEPLKYTCKLHTRHHSTSKSNGQSLNKKIVCAQSFNNRKSILGINFVKSRYLQISNIPQCQPDGTPRLWWGLHVYTQPLTWQPHQIPTE